MLLVTLVYGALATLGSDSGSSPALARHRLRLMVGVELVDAILVGAALFVIGRPPVS